MRVSPFARLYGPLLVLVLLLAWQWLGAGGPPVMAGSVWGGVGYTALLLGLVLSIAADRATSRRPAVRRVGEGLGLAGGLLFLVIHGQAVWRGVRPAWSLLPYVALLLFWWYLWRQLRRPPAQTPE